MKQSLISMHFKCALSVIMVSLFYATYVNSQVPIKLRIDPSRAMGASASELFTEIKYIPLETTKESTFGKIDQLEVTDKYFIILDYDTNSILFFFKDGKYHCKIKGRGFNKQVTPIGIRYFTVNRFSNELAYNASPVIRWVYDFDGKKIREEAYSGEQFVYPLQGNKSIIVNFSVDAMGEAGTSYELSWKEQQRVYFNALPYEKRSTVVSQRDILTSTLAPIYRLPSDTSAFFTRAFDYTVYQIGLSTFQPAYSIILPLSISLPNDFMTNPAYLDKRFSFVVQENPNMIYRIQDVYQVGRFLFMKLASGRYSDNNTIIYDLIGGTVYSAGHIDPDGISLNLPTSFLSRPGIQTAYRNYVYSTISSLTMHESRTSYLNKSMIDDKILQTYFSNGNRNANPVVVQLRPKLVN